MNGFYLIALPLALQLNSLRIHLGLLHLNEHMDRDDSEGQARMLAHEVDVKEQDRWLPAANGHTRPMIQCPSAYFTKTWFKTH